MLSLVTGGTGYLGGRLVETLLEGGDSVRVLHRRSSDVSRLSGAVTLVEGDVTNLESLRRAAEGVNRIFHTAALVRTWVRDPRDFDRINVEGTVNVCKTAQESGCRLVYTSTIFALGPTGPSPVDEDHARAGEDYCTDYERTKTQADRRVREFLNDGLNAVVLYPGLIYGPGPLTQGNYVSIMVRDFLRRRLPGIPGDGRQRWTYAFIVDVVRGHITAAEKGPAGGRYILGGPIASLDETFQLLARITGLSAPRPHLPIGILRVFGWTSEMVAALSGHPPLVTRGVAEMYRRHWAFDSSRAARELDYRLKPLEEGLVEVVSYLRGFL